MNFFQNIIDSAIRKSAEMKDRKEFLEMVEGKAKPIRRAAYMKQMLKEVVQEGIDKAKADVEKKSVKKKTPQDFGIQDNKKDEWAYLNNIGINHPKNKTEDKKPDWAYYNNKPKRNKK